MKLSTKILVAFFSSVLFSSSLIAQTISKEELTFLTSEWKGERFADGRPKVPDALIERAKKIYIDDAWTVLKNEGYLNQFEGGWKLVNDSTMAGRAVTAMYFPSRPLSFPNPSGKRCDVELSSIRLELRHAAFTKIILAKYSVARMVLASITRTPMAFFFCSS